MNSVDKIVDQFVELDPIYGDRAKCALIEYGQESLDLIISRFSVMGHTQSLELRLGELFGYFGEISVNKLIFLLKNGSFDEIRYVACSFRYLQNTHAAFELSKFISLNEDIDTLRCAIDALGYLGAKEYAYLLLDLFSFYEKNPWADKYYWDKLSNNVFLSLLRMATKPEEEGSVFHFYRLPDIERLIRISDDKNLNKFISNNWYIMSIIFSYFKPVATDALIENWLNNDNRSLQKIALQALREMRIVRIVSILRKYVELHMSDDEIKRDVASVLTNIPSKAAAEVVRFLYNNSDLLSPYFKSISLCLAICLDRIEDRDFVEEIYPVLLANGGEVEAHTYYNLGLLGYNDSIWGNAINSEDYIIRAAVAPIYAHAQRNLAIPKLLQIETESSHYIEGLIVLAALVNAGCLEKHNDFRNKLSIAQKNIDFRTIRYTWRREIILALRVIEKGKNEALAIWEKLFGLTAKIANEELQPFVDSIKPKRISKSKLVTKTMKKLFVSHASVDAAKIRPLIDLIEGIGISHTQIFFSTDEAYGVELGENIFERLKRELEGDVFALFILSENFYQSAVCLCEMGAVWIKSNKQIPILIPPFDFKDVRGVFPGSLGFKLDDKRQLNSFKDVLLKYFNLEQVHTSRWEEKRDDYLSKISTLLMK